jgi:low affinity Fe/Cu permease
MRGVARRADDLATTQPDLPASGPADVWRASMCGYGRTVIHSEEPSPGRNGTDDGPRPRSRRVERKPSTRRALPGSSVVSTHSPGWRQRHWTSRLLHRTGEVLGHSGAGFAAATLVVVWLLVGVGYGFPQWWQITLYTTTGSVTFVMVFVIQHTHELQTFATQRKLDELIRASTRADDTLIAVEEASDGDLQALADLNLADRERASTDR